MTSTLHQLVDAIADAFDPLLALLALGAPLLRKPRALRLALSYYLAAAAAWIAQRGLAARHAG